MNLSCDFQNRPFVLQGTHSCYLDSNGYTLKTFHPGARLSQKLVAFHQIVLSGTVFVVDHFYLNFQSLVKKLTTMGNRHSSINNQDAEAASRYPQASDHHHSESRLSVGLAEFFSSKYDDDTMNRKSTGFVTTAAESLSPALVATS